jgi:hypothetical protein
MNWDITSAFFAGLRFKMAMLTVSIIIEVKLSNGNIPMVKDSF